MRSLQIVQTATKIFKILALVGMILSFVGAAFALLGGGLILSLPNLLGTEFLDSVLELGETEQLDIHGAGFTAIAGAVVAAAQGIVLVFAYSYLKRACEDGTPFTHGGAEQLKKLGILTLVVPFCGLVVASCITLVGGTTEGLDITTDIGLGIGMIVLSYLYDYGASLEDRLGGGENTETDRQ